MKKLALIVLALAAIGAVNWFQHRPVSRDAGVLVEREPRQSAPTRTAPISHGDYTLTPLASFEIQARVLSREDYSFDAGSDLSPIDLALGWGRMSDTSIIEQLDIQQSARFYSYRWPDAPPIPAQEIARSSANMHLIPADDAVASALDKVREGEVVTLRGQLVSAHRADGWRWISSLTRDDTGAGACELVLVESVQHE